MNNTERDQLIDDFIAQSAFAGAVRHKIPGDASTRWYERLDLNGKNYILMNAPATDGAICEPGMDEATRRALGYIASARLAAGRIEAFVTIADFIRKAGLAAPQIHAFDAENGIAILDDFGTQQYYEWLQSGQAPEGELYEGAIGALVKLQQARPAETLTAQGVSWNLFGYDRMMIESEGDIFLEWYCDRDQNLNLSAAAQDEFRTTLQSLMHPLLAQQDTLVLRDYHSPNIMWRGAETGLDRVGIIDFQDALRGGRAYDLVSLLQDARRDVSLQLEADMLNLYLQQSGCTDEETLRAEYALWGMQRNIRLVGLWPRLKLRDGKPHYMQQHMARVMAYLQRDLQHPACAPMKQWFDRYLPQFLQAAA